jgi:hypothetical protein
VGGRFIDRLVSGESVDIFGDRSEGEGTPGLIFLDFHQEEEDFI